MFAYTTKSLFLILALLRLILASEVTKTPPDFFSEVFQLIETYSCYKRLHNWPELKKTFANKTQQAKTTTDVYPLIRELLTCIGDRHSHLHEPSSGSLVLEEKLEMPHGHMLTPSIAYLSLPAYNSREGIPYASHAHHAIGQLSTSNPRGWIIDLRKNTGGNMWPMLASVGPFFAEEVLGTFVYPAKDKEFWRYRKGIIYLDSQEMCAIPSPHYDLKIKNVPVAILVGSNTASAAEAVVITFKSRASTHIIGMQTAGLTTSNEEFTLSDGGKLYLAIAEFASPQGETYKGPLHPDISAAEDDTIKEAMAWLSRQ